MSELIWLREAAAEDRETLRLWIGRKSGRFIAQINTKRMVELLAFHNGWDPAPPVPVVLKELRKLGWKEEDRINDRKRKTQSLL